MDSYLSLGCRALLLLRCLVAIEEVVRRARILRRKYRLFRMQLLATSVASSGDILYCSTCE